MDPALFWQLVGTGLMGVMVLAGWIWVTFGSGGGPSIPQYLSQTFGLDMPTSSTVDGVMDGVRVSGQLSVRWGRNMQTRMELELVDDAPGALRMGSLGSSSWPGGLLQGSTDDLELEVAGFGPEVVARLSSKARPIVNDALQAGWQLREGTWHYDEDVMDGYAVEQALRACLRAIRALRFEGSVDEALTDRATDEGPESLRLRAAELRLEAPVELASAERSRLLGEQDEVGLMVAERLRDAGSLRRWLRDVLVSRRVRAAVALAELGDADDAVRDVLKVGLTDPELRAAAADALGRVGSIHDVPVLREVSGRGIDAAVRAIQARATEAEVGQVSVAAADGGGVALAERRPRQPEA